MHYVFIIKCCSWFFNNIRKFYDFKGLQKHIISDEVIKDTEGQGREDTWLCNREPQGPR